MTDRLLRLYLRYLRATTRPIVLGPFRSELGFEVLYWLPFVHWCLKKARIDPARCIALSRGGMGHLYPAANQVDLYALRGVEAVRLENAVDAERRKMLKQTSVTPWDRAVAREAVERVHKPGTRFHLLHPSWMYRLFSPVWEDQAPLSRVLRQCSFQPLPVPQLPAGLVLPEKFIAVRFYERATLPMQPEIKTLIRELVERVSRTHPVVILAQPHCVDDHVDLPLAGEHILHLSPVSPDQNLLLQAAVLARAQAFVGTYGGVAQWALRYGKPSLSVYAHFSGTSLVHRMLSHLLSAQMKVPFEMLELPAIRLWQSALVPVLQAATVAPAQTGPVAVEEVA